MSDSRRIVRQFSQNVKETTVDLGKRTLSFFGISQPDDEEVNAWNQRRLRFTLQKFGNLNTEKLGSEHMDRNLCSTPQSHMFADLEEEPQQTATGELDCSTSSYGPQQNRLLSQSPGVLHQLTRPPIYITRPPVYRRGNTTPGNFNRQVSLRSNLIVPAPTDWMDQSPEGGQQPRRRTNAVKAIGRVLVATAAVKTPSSLVGSGNNYPMKHFSFSHQHINNVEFQGDDFFNNFGDRKSVSKSRRPMAGVRHLRRHIHSNFMFRIMCCLMKHDKESESICSRISDDFQFRPYFSYWVTCVQVLVFVVGCVCYGFAPVGLRFRTEYRADVVVPDNGLQSVCWHVTDNLWLGPRYADLVRMGARYSPCMRSDSNLRHAILLPQLRRENRSGCCIRNDGGGCYQSTRNRCSVTLATWHSWRLLPDKNQSNSPRGEPVTSSDQHHVAVGVSQRIRRRSSGPVCGQDPDFCLNPASIPPFQWSDDVTKWPICVRSSVVVNFSTVLGAGNNHPHMHCEVTGRPCCAGIKGECIITSPDHCTFIRGHFHSSAFLCSQVNCLGDVCGMLSFQHADRPDQLYRLLTSLFLHAGVVHLLITVILQLLFLRDFEKLMGWHRTGIIYFLSGLIGNLCSAVFLPYKVEVGPSGACFAFLSIIIIELIKSWCVIKTPQRVLLKYSAFTLFLLLIGLLPWIDNYAHIAGLVSGALLSFVFLPFLGLPADVDHQPTSPPQSPAPSSNSRCCPSTVDSRRYKALVWRLSTLLSAAIVWLLLLAGLIVLFKYHPLRECTWCKFLTCLPLAKRFCSNMDVNITERTHCLS